MTEAEFIASCLKDCRCCQECGMDRPCAGVMAGGLCEQACRCEDDERAWWCDDNERAWWCDDNEGDNDDEDE